MTQPRASRHSKPRHFLVLPAAGSGQRMGADLPKQYLPVLGKPLLQHTLENLATLPCFEKVALAVSPNDPWWPGLHAALPATLAGKLLVAAGGAERADSVLNALLQLRSSAHDSDWVLVHDAVRPCIHRDDVERLLTQLAEEPAGGLLASPLRETLKRADASQHVEATVDRRALWCAATPQMFRFGVLLAALQAAAQADLKVTDEAQAVELAGHPVRLVAGRADNIKVTFPEDLRLVELLLQGGRDATAHR